MITKVYFYEQAKEYNKIIFTTSTTDSHLFWLLLWSSFSSYQEEHL